MKNNQYDPTGNANCSLETLISMGNTIAGCSVEPAEIRELYLDEPASAGSDTCKNPITPYTAWADNEAALLSFKAAVDNSLTGKVKFLNGTGEKPEPEQSEATLAGNVKVKLGVPLHNLKFNIDRIDQTTYQFLRKLQKFGGTYFIRYATEKYLYGGDNGIEGEVLSVTFTYGGGGSDPTKATLVIQFKAYCEPVRDLRPW